MVTLAQNQAAKEQHAGFIQQCEAYKDLLTSMSLPYSIDMEAHKLVIRLRIADELLKADAGLKMRWDILRTDEGRQKLRKETAATVDLAGYEDVEQLEQSLQQLRAAYKAVGALPDKFRPSFEELAGQYNLDLAAAIDSQTIYWDKDTEKVLAYFRELGQQLHQLEKVLHSAGRRTADLRAFVTSLTLYEKEPYFLREWERPVPALKAREPNEELIFRHLIPQLRKNDALADFPALVK